MAINSDPIEPIFNIAHLCIVGGLFQEILELVKHIEAVRNGAYRSRRHGIE